LFDPDTKRLEAIDKSAVWLDYITRHKDQVTWDKLRMIGTYALTYFNSLVAMWHAFLRVYTAISSLLCNSAEQSSCLFYPDTERLEAIDKSAVWLDYSTRHKDQVTWDKLRMIGTYALTYCNSLVATWHAFLRVYTSISSPLCNSAITQQSTATICMSGAEHSDCDQ